MVTTTSIRELFGQALQKVQELVQDLDRSEHELYGAASILFKEAVGVVKPVLKYVDESVRIDPNYYRGVWIDKETLLTRDGLIVDKEGGSEIPIDEYYSFADTDQMVNRTIRRLMKLGEVLNQALSKMDERREHLAERAQKLEEATTVFKR